MVDYLDWREWAIARLKSSLPIIRLTLVPWPKDTVHMMVIASCDIGGVPYLGAVEYFSGTRYVNPRLDHRRVPQPIRVEVCPFVEDPPSPARSFFQFHVEGRDRRWYGKNDTLCFDGTPDDYAEEDGYFPHQTIRATLHLKGFWGMILQGAADQTRTHEERELLSLVEMKLDTFLKSNASRIAGLFA